MATSRAKLYVVCLIAVAALFCAVTLPAWNAVIAIATSWDTGYRH